MENIKNIIIFVLTLMCVFLYQCNKTYVETKGDTVTEVKYDHKHTRSIVVVPVPLPKTLYLTNNIPYPVYIPHIDDTSKKSAKYNVPFEDTLIKGNIESYIGIPSGKLEHQNFTYKLLKPNTIIHDIDSIFVTTTITRYEKKRKLFVGSSLYYNQKTVSLSFDALFKTKRDMMFGAGYDPFNKVYSIKIYTGLGK